MNYQHALGAYQRAQHSALPLSGMEEAVFCRAISLLKLAQQREIDYPTYSDALKFNQRMWTFIQSYLCDNGSDIPESIRANLLNLSLLVDRQTIGALAAPMASKLDILIDINIAISRGLAHPQPTSPQSANPPAAPTYGHS